MRDRDVVPAARSLDVPFEDLMADDLDVVARVYARAGLTLPADVRATLATHARSHARGVHG